MGPLLKKNKTDFTPPPPHIITKQSAVTNQNKQVEFFSVIIPNESSIKADE